MYANDQLCKKHGIGIDVLQAGALKTYKAIMWDFKKQIDHSIEQVLRFDVKCCRLLNFQWKLVFN